MQQLLQFVVLGLGVGAAYALLAQGVVLIYRGSGIVNFAQGGFATVSAYVCYLTLTRDAGWAFGPACVTAVAASAGLGLAFQRFELRPLRARSPLVRLIASLALLVVLQAAVQLHYGAQFVSVRTPLPSKAYMVGGIAIPQDRLLVFLIAVAISALLSVGIKRTRTGLAITASAQSELAVSSLGWSTNTLSALTWTMGAGLGGLAGVLVAPNTGLQPTTFFVTITVSALAAALVGGFTSFSLTLAGGLVIGIAESLALLYQPNIEDFVGIDRLDGLPKAVPFLGIVIVLVVRGRGIPLRSHISDQLPRLGTGAPRWAALALVVVLISPVLLSVESGWSNAASVSFTAGISILSVVILTGFTGQLSLAQTVIGGLGALFAARLVASAGWPYELAFIGGVALAVPAGLLFALPALRTRGVNLAVLTLGLGAAVQSVVLSNGPLTGNSVDGGTSIGSVTVAGIEVNALQHPGRWAFVCLVALVAVSLLVGNLRRSRTGRRLIAVRTNERAATSLGVNVVAVKLYAFGLAAGVAAVGGILFGFRNPTVTYQDYNVINSITLVGNAVIGGIGYVVGAAFGSQFTAGGINTRVSKAIGLGSWDVLIGGVALMALLRLHTNGVADKATSMVKRVRRSIPVDRRSRSRAGVDASNREEPAIGRVEAEALVVRNLTVRFGSVTAVDDVSFHVDPGEVVGLIGPNGAGKTTTIDAITGFVRPAGGLISLGESNLEHMKASTRARKGLRRSFQSVELFDDISVLDNIASGADDSSALSWLSDIVWPRSVGLPPSARLAISDFALTDDLDRLPPELPYGRRRLVGIARSVASGPSVALLDEPAAGLDQAETMELSVLVRRLARERGMGILLVEHDMSMVMATCDRLVVLDFGRVIASGSPEAIREDPAVRSAYLGTSMATSKPMGAS